MVAVVVVERIVHSISRLEMMNSSPNISNVKMRNSQFTANIFFFEIVYLLASNGNAE